MAIGCAVQAKPAHRTVRIGIDGQPWIEAFRCEACGAVTDSRTMACRACASRIPPSPFRVGQSGKLWSWSVVHRSYPGIAVPFVSVIVDMDDGLTLKGTLRDVASAGLLPGLPVRLEFDDAGGAHNNEGAPYVGFHFVPQGDAG